VPSGRAARLTLVPAKLDGPRPEVIFLDVGDTMVRAHPSWAAVYRHVLAGFGVVVDEARLGVALEHTFGEGGDHPEGPFEASAEASYQRLKSFDARVLAALGQSPQPDDFFRALESAFGERSAWWVFEDVPAALATMRESGFRLGVISNWSWSAPELLHTLELARHFEMLVISDRVGYLKPHSGIFEHALAVAGISAAQAIHVGDSVRADVRGARSAGIRPVLIDRHPDAHGRPDVSAATGGDGCAVDADVPVIRDLNGLLDLLDVPRPPGVAAP